ncbi:hypothetical protein BT69DRAFT_1340043 [Atractiella rhizophila]|nr:hypothetical protein BT69DRAFT_1340043 [Atractiella rhizophila]
MPKKKPSTSKNVSSDIPNIPEDEQLRLLQSSGLLKRVPRSPTTTSNEKPLLSFDESELPAGVKIHEIPVPKDSGDADDEEDDDGEPVWGEVLLDAILWTVPFSFLYVGLDVAIHAQYASHLAAAEAFKDVAKFFPSFLFLSYLTLPHPSRPTPLHVILAIFGLTTFSGLRLIWMVNNSPYRKVMAMCPILGALWVWGTVRLDLRWCLASLFFVTAGVYWYDLQVLRWETGGGLPG